MSNNTSPEIPLTNDYIINIDDINPNIEVNDYSGICPLYKTNTNSIYASSYTENTYIRVVTKRFSIIYGYCISCATCIIVFLIMPILILMLFFLNKINIK
jgi:hypothetical protein